MWAEGRSEIRLLENKAVATCLTVALSGPAEVGSVRLDTYCSEVFRQTVKELLK